MNNMGEIYKTPESDLLTEKQAGTFYVVSARKYLILFIATLGFYRLYWFYKNWKFYKISSGKDIWPPLRALFSIFFVHSLFGLVDKTLEEKNRTYRWQPALVATFYILLEITETIANWMSEATADMNLADYIFFVTTPLIGWCLYKAQMAINLACDDPEGNSNSNLSAANWAWIIPGSFLWILILFGLYAFTTEVV